MTEEKNASSLASQTVLGDSKLSLKIADSKNFRETIDAIGTIVDEATFTADELGLRLRMMDPSRVAMVDFEWPKAMFETYICNGTLKIGVHITELLKLLKRAGPKDTLELSDVTTAKTLKLRLSISGQRVFTVPLMEPSEEQGPLPKLTLLASAKLQVETLKSALDDAKLVSDHVQMECFAESLVLSAAGDLMTGTMSFNKTSEGILELTGDTAQHATFSLQYLVDLFAKIYQISDICTLELATDMPLKLVLNQPGEAKLHFYLAPRIEGD